MVRGTTKGEKGLGTTFRGTIGLGVPQRGKKGWVSHYRGTIGVRGSTRYKFIGTFNRNIH